jgi:hypothetical protein
MRRTQCEYKANFLGREYQNPNDVKMGQMMNHLIETQAVPKTRLISVMKSPQVFRPRFDSIHSEVNNKIDKCQPPKLRFQIHSDQQSADGMHGAMEG